MRITLLILLSLPTFLLGQEISHKESFPGQGLQPAYTTWMVTETGSWSPNGHAYPLSYQYFEFEFPENPEYTQHWKQLREHYYRTYRSLDVDAPPPLGNAHQLQMQAEPVGRMIFLTLKETTVWGKNKIDI